MYDVIIIGAGAAGMTAAIYTSRKALKTALITIEIGGQAVQATNIENYPGYKGKGFDLMNKFREQVVEFGTELIPGRVNKLIKKGEGFEVTLTNANKYETKSVILAYGKVPRKLDIPGEEEYIGKGLHVCAVCDAPLYADKVVAVVGGGNSALGSAIYLSKIAKKVYLIHKRDEFRGDEIIVNRVKEKDNIEILLSHIPKKIKGENEVEKFVLENFKDNSERELELDGIFLEIGFTIDVDFVKELIEVNNIKEIVVDKNCNTSQKGIFAAGDVTNMQYKQIVVSAGEGAKAALSAHAYLQGKEIIGTDWDY